jgi:hypothetical protein
MGGSTGYAGYAPAYPMVQLIRVIHLRIYNVKEKTHDALPASRWVRWVRCEVAIPIPNSRRRAALASSTSRTREARSAHFVPGKEASGQLCLRSSVLAGWPTAAAVVLGFWPWKHSAATWTTATTVVLVICKVCRLAETSRIQHTTCTGLPDLIIL